MKTHEENSKNPKTQNPHILGVSMKGALSGKIERKKSADSGSPESQLRRRRVRFGNWTIPLRSNSYCTEDDSQSRNKNHDACAKKLNEEYELTEKAKTKAVELVKQATEKLKQSLKQ